MNTIKKLIPDYALGLLEPDQAKEVEQFLESCDACQADLEHYNTMFVSMVELLPKLEPESSFASLKTKLESSETGATNVTPSVNTETPFASVASDVIPQAPKSPNWWQTLSSQLLGAWRYQMATAALALSLVAVSLWGWGQYQEQLASTTNQALITQWLASASTKTIPLSSDSGEVLGSLLVQDNRALVVLENPPTDKRVYQAWGELNSVCTSLAISDKNVFEIAWQSAKYDSIIVSSEPLGGSESSTDVLSQVVLF